MSKPAPPRDSLLKFQIRDPLSKDELYQLNKKAIMDYKLIIIDLTKVKSIDFMSQLTDYAHQHHDIILNFSMKG